MKIFWTCSIPLTFIAFVYHAQCFVYYTQLSCKYNKISVIVCLLSELRTGKANNPHSTGYSWRPLSIVYFHSLLLLSWFIDLCLRLVLVSTDVDPDLFVLDYIWNIHMYIVYFVITLIATPCVRSVGCVFAYRCTLDDDIKWKF